MPARSPIKNAFGSCKNNYVTNINDIQSSGSKKQGNSKSAMWKNLSTDYHQHVSGY